ncbi:MAG: hypothetical protein ACOH2D_05120 [Gelidibacter sp.]|uniref:hypothetical protein n=1 Tax=Gelidibacter sp. TaxID=2018083 RepID=UPI0032674871
MKTKITPHHFIIDNFKWFLILLMLLSCLESIAQEFPTYFIVSSVAPTRVTLQSKVVITADPGTIPPSNRFTTLTCENIYKDSKATLDVDTGRTVVTITIAPYFNQANGINIPLDSDVGPNALKIIGKDVYIGSYAPENQVFLEYVLPTSRTLIDSSSNMVKITEIFTTFNGFWRSSEWKNNPTDPTKMPNTSHDLLGFTYNGVIYSTGVNDALLTTSVTPDEASTISYQTFKAYSTNGVSGNTTTDNYLAMADMIDGKLNQTVLSSSIENTSIYSVLIDGVNGLDLGTGVTNFSKTTNVSFYSGNGNVGAIEDEIPDLLLTQIAEPGGADVYYYSDHLGNVVGRPVSLLISNQKTNGSALLAEWSLDFYKMTSTTYDLSVPTSGVEITSRKRPLRMAAFKLNEFEINASNIGSVSNIKMAAGGGADLAFIAYNRAAFDIKTPVVKRAPISRFVCKLPSSSTINFNAEGAVDGGYSTTNPIPAGEVLKYRWFKNQTLISGATTNEYTIPFSPITSDELGTYKLEISNLRGAVILPVNFSEGGVPVVWNGATFDLPPAYIAAGVTVANADRNLIFSRTLPYNRPYDLEGCDCLVPAGSTVTIPVGNTLKLYNNIVVEGITNVLDENDLIIEEIPAGTFILEDGASLIQTKDVTVNENSGNIIVKRETKPGTIKKFDYVYWSSPVAGFNVNSIEGSRRYEWDVTVDNTNNGTAGTFGNWIAPLGLGIMTPGKGYIVRVPSSVPETPPVNYILNNTFEGVPNNGDYYVQIKTTPPGSSMNPVNQHWNLIGNPYPSAINPSKLLSDNIDVLSGVLQVWTHKNAISETPLRPFYQNFKLKYSDDYLTYNLTASTDKDFKGYIASGQGFMAQVEADPTNKYVKFTNAMRFGPTGESAYDNTQFYRGTGSSNTSSNESTEKQLIWLALTEESQMATVAVVGYVEGATNGKDKLYDANSGPGSMRLYSVLEDSDFLIQGRALPFEDSDKVSLGIEILKNGIYKIGIDHLKGSLMLNEDQGIYLEDTYNNVIHNLRNSPYSFTANAGDVKDRFVLRYTNKTPSVDDNQMSETFVYVKNEQLYVKASKNIESVVVYDLTGKKLMDYKLEGFADKFNSQFQFPKGAYLTVIKLENTGLITKKVMN